MTFQDLNLSEPIMRALADERYATPTPIQARAIPPVMAGRDVLGCAQTGTGKTAAFALPILHRLTAAAQQPAAADQPAPQSAPAPQPAPTRHAGSGHGARGARPARPVRVLVLAPTRELAGQIHESFRTYGRHTPMRYAVVFGGVSQYPQAQALRGGVDVLIATPGRLLDLVEQRLADLSKVETLVLDEGDHMLDMGFIHDIRKIIAKLPSRRQNLLFSATMPPEIRELADSILREPVRVQAAPTATPAETVQQSVYFVERRNKPTLLTHFLQSHGATRTLVFTRTKHGADKVVRHLVRQGIRAQAIHGNKSQNARNRAMADFKGQRPPVLVATDIAARGLDIDEISHVVNYDLPNVPETYVHRIGRTGRAGAVGAAVSFCDGEERSFLNAIEKLTRRNVPVREDHPVYPPPEPHHPAAARPASGAHRPVAAAARPAYRPHPQPHPAHGARPSAHSHPAHRPGAGGSRPQGSRSHAPKPGAGARFGRSKRGR